MNPHANSLSPDRQPGESFEDYKERRRQLQTLAKKAGKYGRVLYDSSATNARKMRTPMRVEKKP